MQYQLLKSSKLNFIDCCETEKSCSCSSTRYRTGRILSLPEREHLPWTGLLHKVPVSRGTWRGWRGVEWHSPCQYREGKSLETVLLLPCLQSSPSWILSPVSLLPSPPCSPEHSFPTEKPIWKINWQKKVIFLTWINSPALSLTPAAQTLVLVQLQES